ncbi:hypothetical protein [Membranihabitans maritimus]|uniref:hypothetical protein n=1 Tax=Membranihabitans maritimus TaxID=2904244 RepID=UPI001F3B2D7D|nr:hypothetical protein [Membranihabitans maritimus]
MILLIGFVGTIGAILIGCEKEKNKVADEYYVKYEVNSSTIYIGGKLDVTINTEMDNPEYSLSRTRFGIDPLNPGC